MSILPKAICRFRLIPINIPVTFFQRSRKINIKFVWNPLRPKAEEILRRNKDGDITFPDCKLYYIAMLILTVWCQH